MAMRSVARRVCLNRMMEGGGGRLWIPRYFSDGNGRVLSEEERAAENVYIRKMEREKMEKVKLKAAKEKASSAEKEKSEKKTEEATHKG